MGFDGVGSRASAFFHAPEGGEDDGAVKGSEEQCSTTTSSSIGRNSDVSSDRSMGEDNESGENEVQSAYNGDGPLHAMETLEQVLPIRRGISKFYHGKSKSFTSLADAASSPSVKDIVKPENAYGRRRRNLMAFNHGWDKNKNYPLRGNGGSISKRTISLSRSTLALALAMSNSDSSSSITSEDSASTSNSPCPSPRPPLHPRYKVSSSVAGPPSPLQRNFSNWRSFSVADLQHCAIAATIKMPSSSSIENETAHRS